jgi:hypothetical protein
MLRVRRYVESRVTHAGQASERELSAWLDEHAAALGTRDRDVARAQLAERRVADEVAALLGAELGWDDVEQRRQAAAYRAAIAEERGAPHLPEVALDSALGA